MTSHDKPDAPHDKYDAPHDKPDAPHDKPDAPHAAPPAGPPIVEYPKVLYHADGRSLTVTSKDAETAAATDGFGPTPGAPAKSGASAKPHTPRA